MWNYLRVVWLTCKYTNAAYRIWAVIIFPFEAGEVFPWRWVGYLSSKYNVTLTLALSHIQLYFTYTKKLVFFLQKCIKASYIMDSKVMGVEGRSVTSGVTTNMCKYEHQRIVFHGVPHWKCMGKLYKTIAGVHVLHSNEALLICDCIYGNRSKLHIGSYKIIHL